MFIRSDLPRARPGEVVGLLGGSFDPAHEGHLRISRQALARFRLDRVWWLVSPGNPLKLQQPAPLPRRLEVARGIARDPRIQVSAVEATLGTRYTVETVTQLQRLFPRQRFIWLIGTDNLVQLPGWSRWEQIMRRLPVGVVARPGSRLAGRCSKAAARYRAAQLPESMAPRLAVQDPPAWCLINIPMSADSSSAIRASGAW